MFRLDHSQNEQAAVLGPFATFLSGLSYDSTSKLKDALDKGGWTGRVLNELKDSGGRPYTPIFIEGFLLRIKPLIQKALANIAEENSLDETETVYLVNQVSDDPACHAWLEELKLYVYEELLDESGHLRNDVFQQLNSILQTVRSDPKPSLEDLTDENKRKLVLAIISGYVTNIVGPLAVEKATTPNVDRVASAFLVGWTNTLGELPANAVENTINNHFDLNRVCFVAQLDQFVKDKKLHNAAEILLRVIDETYNQVDSEAHKVTVIKVLQQLNNYFAKRQQMTLPKLPDQPFQALRETLGCFLHDLCVDAKRLETNRSIWRARYNERISRYFVDDEKEVLVDAINGAGAIFHRTAGNNRGLGLMEGSLGDITQRLAQIDENHMLGIVENGFTIAQQCGVVGPEFFPDSRVGRNMLALLKAHGYCGFDEISLLKPSDLITLFALNWDVQSSLQEEIFSSRYPIINNLDDNGDCKHAITLELENEGAKLFAHYHFKKICAELDAAISKQPDNSLLRSSAQKVLDEARAIESNGLIKTLELPKLTSFVAATTKVLRDPSSDNLKTYAEKTLAARGVGKRWGKVMGYAMAGFLSASLLTAAVTLSVVTFGLAVPVIALSTAATIGVLSGSGVLGASGLAAGSFFARRAQKGELYQCSRELEKAAIKTSAAPAA